MHDRIRILREEQGLSRVAFGERLGVSGDVINNLERGRVEVKDHIVKLICAEYSVNEDWLRNGTEPIYIQAPTFSLDDFVRQHGGTDLELDIMKAYFELEPDIRSMLVQHFKSRLNASRSEPSADNPSKECEAAEAAYIKSRSGNAQGTGRSASNTTADTEPESGESNNLASNQ